MAHDFATLHQVLRAAEAVLEARENQMLTSEEWDALQHAVAAVSTAEGPNSTVEDFGIAEKILTRSVTPVRGVSYQHTCDLDVFEAVAHAIDALHGSSFTYEEFRQSAIAPFTQVSVAIAFLNERGCIVPAQRRRSVAATDCMHLDAMIEWHAIAERRAGTA